MQLRIFIFITIANLIFVSCRQQERISDHRRDRPRWLFVGWSCAPDLKRTARPPACTTDAKREYLYAGWVLLAEHMKSDRECREYARSVRFGERPGSPVMAMDDYITRAMDIENQHVAACLIQKARRSGVYRCALAPSGYGGQACCCLYYFRYPGGERRFRKLEAECKR